MCSMRIDTDVKLDYSDVLLRPKRSTMGSRKDVDLVREYTFRNSQKGIKAFLLWRQIWEE